MAKVHIPDPLKNSTNLAPTYMVPIQLSAIETIYYVDLPVLYRFREFVPCATFENTRPVLWIACKVTVAKGLCHSLETA